MKSFLLFKRSISSFLRICIVVFSIICLTTSIASSQIAFDNSTNGATGTAAQLNPITVYSATGVVFTSVPTTSTVGACLGDLQKFIFFPLPELYLTRVVQP